MDSWVAPGGEALLTLDPRSPVASFVRWVCEQTRMVLWDRAAGHYLGRGLERGPDQSLYKLLKSLRKEGRHTEAGGLECILTCGFLFPLRISQCYPSVPATYPWCGAPRAYPLHMWWTCHHHRTSASPAVLRHSG